MKLKHQHWFDTLTIEVEDKAAVLMRAEEHQLNLRTDIHNAVGITFSETTTRADLIELYTVLTGEDKLLDIDTLDKQAAAENSSLPANLRRSDIILATQIFIVIIAKRI